MELALFVQLIRIICKLDKFLKSFERLELNKNERGLLVKTKRIFLSFIVNTGLMMGIDTMYSISAPYLWIINVTTTTKWQAIMFDSTV